MASSVIGSGATNVPTAGLPPSGSKPTPSPAAQEVIKKNNVKLAEIEKQLQEFAKTSQRQSALAARQAKIETQSFEKSVRKSPLSSASSATDIGTLVKDSTRLNVFSGIKPDDKGDFFRFKVQNNGEARIAFKGDPGVRLQIVTRFGGVVADSKAGQGPSSDNFVALDKGEFKLAPGEYFLKITTNGRPQKDAKGNTPEIQNYAIQISQGVFKKDFDTVAQLPRAGDTGLPQQSQSQLDLQNMLQASQSFVNSLPPIGTSAISKLQGALVNVFG
jgi:hypothetical protein